MVEDRFYEGLERGHFVQTVLLLLVFGPFLVLAYRAIEAAKLTGFILAYSLIPLLYVIPWIIGLRLKKAIKGAQRAGILSLEAAELCDSWLRSAQWSTYAAMAPIVLFSKFVMIR
jgi:hypothetical protein